MKSGYPVAKTRNETATFSVKCWAAELEMIERAALITEKSKAEYIVKSALERAATDLGLPVPELPEFPRRPRRGMRKLQEVAARKAGLPLEAWQAKVLIEAARKAG